MLIKCTKSELNTYIDFAYELATNPEKSAYPTYCDGIKTKEMFVEGLEKVFDRENEELLCRGGRVMTSLINTFPGKLRR